ncbi:MAG: hypothetical protein JST54_28830 [Deltaproteobacteria bacterium]|nr:hypothetical protein [Deltaproteobacteria bacterium]
MRRIFFGMCALGSGLAALHFTSRWLQLKDTSDCMGDASCEHMALRGGVTHNDRQVAIGLFVLTGICVWVASGKDH